MNQVFQILLLRILQSSSKGISQICIKNDVSLEFFNCNIIISRDNRSKILKFICATSLYDVLFKTILFKYCLEHFKNIWSYLYSSFSSTKDASFCNWVIFPSKMLIFMSIKLNKWKLSEFTFNPVFISPYMNVDNLSSLIFTMIISFLFSFLIIQRTLLP